eukprot:scaffold65954_cov47-Prasinocladus_malaysianus.AAC.2
MAGDHPKGPTVIGFFIFSFFLSMWVFAQFMPVLAVYLWWRWGFHNILHVLRLLQRCRDHQAEFNVPLRVSAGITAMWLWCRLWDIMCIAFSSGYPSVGQLLTT